MPLCPPPVPVPTPSITASPSIGALYAGTTLSLTCDYTLSPSVDTAPQSAVVWMVGGAALDTSSGRISATGDALSFSPLATSDTGSYTCQLAVTAQQTHVTVQAPDQSAARDITVQSNVLCCMIIHSLLYYNQCIVHTLFYIFMLLIAPFSPSPPARGHALQITILPCMLVLPSLSPVL